MGGGQHGDFLVDHEGHPALPHRDLQDLGELQRAFLLHDDAPGHFHESRLALHGLPNLHLWLLHAGGAAPWSNFLVLHLVLYAGAHRNQFYGAATNVGHCPPPR